ncbi:MAG: polysaccharide deacetylase family protein [Bacteroidota bacterium]
MVLIYTANTSPRLQYTCSFIFKEQMQVDFEITTDAEKFKQFDGVRINYSNIPITNTEYRIGNVNLLFENNIQQQPIDCFEANGYKAFFKTDGADLSFDIFAATFYLLSRYEEYLPHEKDMYGRYAHENSLAFKEGFLKLPLINTWINDFRKALKTKYPTFNFKLSTFNFLPTYDIDIAYSYKHKSWLRTVGAFMKSPSVERVKVLSGSQKDPFDSYEWMDALHQQHNLQPIYFFLAAQKNTLYDKNILPNTTAFHHLVKHQADKYETGIHPGWQSGDNFLLLKQEKKILESIIDKHITRSRQHYIRFHLPSGYRRLLEAGITDDYSMGYGSINGFRASVTSSFYWYDLEKEEQTHLRIHPFCFMDANSFYEQHFSAEQAYDESMHYLKICREVNGTLITIWHNNFLGTDRKFAGWRECYEKFIALVQP